MVQPIRNRFRPEDATRVPYSPLTLEELQRRAGEEWRKAGQWWRSWLGVEKALEEEWRLFRAIVIRTHSC